MARNNDRNAYWTVGIPRHSETYKRLLADAKEKGISVPTLIALRISDVYTGPAQTVRAIASVPAPEISSDPDLHAEPTSDIGEATSPAETEIDQEGMNAFAALDVWG